MLVTVWRHGESGPGSPDRDRTLTDRGRSDVHGAAPRFVDELKRRELALPTALFFSRWRRTRQTADLLAESLPGVRAEALEALVPGREPSDVDAALGSFAGDAGHLLLVSHQPLVSALIDHWLGTRGEVPPLTPGAFAVLDLPVPAAGCASLRWWSAPSDDRV